MNMMKKKGNGMDKMVRYQRRASIFMFVVCAMMINGVLCAAQQDEQNLLEKGLDWFGKGIKAAAEGLGNAIEKGAQFVGRVVTGDLEAKKSKLTCFKSIREQMEMNETRGHVGWPVTAYDEYAKKNYTFHNKTLLQIEIEKLEKEVITLEEMARDARKGVASSTMKALENSLQLENEKAKIKAAEQAKGAENRKTVLAAIGLLTQPENLKKIVLTGGGLAGLTFLSFYSLKLGYGFILERMKPQLVSKTSINFFGMRKKTPPSRMHLFVGSKRLREDITRIINKVNNARNKGGTLSNIVFYGPPGTGKTMMAEEIAIQSGMDYAIFSAGDFGKLPPEEQKVQLEKLFGWSGALIKQGKSLVIFIDEAEEFLRDRRFGNAREGLLSMFLNRVPEQRSKNLMFVFATNFLKQLDGAVLSRIDEAIPFSVPGHKEREQMILNYLKDDIQKFVGKKGERIAITQETMNKIAATFSRDEYTKGFVGRNIAGLVALLQDVGITKGRVTFEDAEPILLNKVKREKYLAAIEKEKQQKSKFEGYVGTSEEEEAEGIAAAEKQEKNEPQESVHQVGAQIKANKN